MLRGRVISSLTRLSSSCAAPSSAPCVAVNDKASEINDDQTLEPLKGKKYEKRITRPRFAVLLSFHGANYYGMQFNTHGVAIENVLFDAFVKTGVLPEEKKTNVQYYLEFARASRTDRRVSALRQVISLRLTKGKNLDNINEYLPDDIRVLGMKPVSMLFNAQKYCNARSYSYIMPTYALCNFRSGIPSQNYRIDADTLLKTNQVFQTFRGSHRFHNYTEKRDMWDPRSIRNIVDTSISNPFMAGDIEMIQFSVKGHSFMLHQIRRMMGMVIAIMRGKAPFHLLQETFEHPMMPAPTAPSLGLLLEKQYFDGYNSKFTNDRYPPLDWDEYDDEVEKFKCEKIVPYIVAKEQEEGHMEEFLNLKLRKHSFASNQESSRLRQIGKWNSIEDLEEQLKKLEAVNDVEEKSNSI